MLPNVKRASHRPHASTAEHKPQTAVNMGDAAIDQPLEAWLTAIKLQAYTAKMAAEGYDEIKFLLDAEPDDIDELIADIGMKKPHARSFRKELAILAGMQGSVAAPAAAAPPPPADATAALRQQLSALKPSELLLRARTWGLAEEVLSEAADAADPKAALVDLIFAVETAPDEPEAEDAAIGLAVVPAPSGAAPEVRRRQQVAAQPVAAGMFAQLPAFVMAITLALHGTTDLWRPPADGVSVAMSNAVQAVVQALIPPGGVAGFWPTVVLTYATGRRRGSADAEGAGPGMYFAAAMVAALAQAGFPCFSGLCIPGGVDWKTFLPRLQLKRIKRAKAKVLVVLQSAPLYDSAPCLLEIFTALENGVTIIPVRLELGLPAEEQQWVAHRDSLELSDNMMREKVQAGLNKLNSVPARGTLLDQVRATEHARETNTHTRPQRGTRTHTHAEPRKTCRASGCSVSYK
eukprot:SAG11_NODE_1232_length_5452_cov_73.066131_3_plen_462_part_00